MEEWGKGCLIVVFHLCLFHFAVPRHHFLFAGSSLRIFRFSTISSPHYNVSPSHHYRHRECHNRLYSSAFSVADKETRSLGPLRNSLYNPIPM